MPDERQGEERREKEIFKDYHALLIGISRYKNQDDIDWTISKIYDADRDAQSVRDTLEAIGYPPSQIHCLFNEEATVEAIQRKLRYLGAAWRFDFLFIFWAGHGVLDEHTRSFLLCHDTNLGDLSRTALPVDEVIHLVVHANSAKRAIFLDTCHSSPKSAQIFRIRWIPSDLTNNEHAMAFVGASTYLAVAQAPFGGILATCLKEALSDCSTSPCDPEGTVYLADVINYLQLHMRPRARAAWEKDNRRGPVPQHPYIVFLPGHDAPMGRNIPTYIRKVIDHSELPEPVKKLASMINWKDLFR